MTQIKINIDQLTSESLRGVAYALLKNVGSLRTRGDEQRLYFEAKDCIVELERRANGGDVSELREMLDGWRRFIDSSRIFDPARSGSFAARDR